MPTIVNLICKHCKKTFITKKGREKNFCSKACESNDRTNNNKIYYIEKQCEYCNNIFKSKKKENKKFCSYKCSGLNKKLLSREKRNCLECGNLFNERIKHKRKFCSEQCRKIWQSKPENKKNRLEKTKNGVYKKYGVENTFQVKNIRLKAHENSKKKYKKLKECGDKNLFPGLLKIEENKRKKLIKRFDEKKYIILEFNGDNIKVQHPDGHIFENNRKLLVNRLNHDVELSTKLQPIGSPKTTFELKICKFLKNNNINYISNNRKIIEGELDIYIPEYKLAIEIDGLYWHSEYYLNDDYHINKTKKCEEKKIQLLHFFEDELLEKYDIIESMLQNKLNLINNKILAKKCEIKEIIDNYLVCDFLKNNHIQGNINASIKIGLYYNNELVSIMVFGKLRKLHNNMKKEGEYEMLRFCDKLNTKIIGSASKLYKFFKSKYKPIKVIGFANKRYSQGKLYKQLNFNFEYNTTPNYYYIIGKQRKHKLLFKKNILIKEGFDDKKTEHQIMLERKIPRIYDCGNIKYIDSCN